MDKIKVMIIDEQALFRAGVRQILSEQTDIEILECDPAQNPLELIEASLPDVALLGSDLASRSGVELGRKIAQYYPNTKVIVLSPDPNDEELFEVIKTAAAACLSGMFWGRSLSPSFRTPIATAPEETITGSYPSRFIPAI